MMSPVYKTPKVLGQLVGALVIGLVALALAASTVLLWLGQRQLREAVESFASLSQANKEDRVAERSAMERKLQDALDGKSAGGAALLLGSHGLWQGQLDKAGRLFGIAAEERPESPDPFLGAAALFLKKAELEPGVQDQHLNKAREMLQRAFENGADFEVEVFNGAIAILEGKAEAALKLYERLGKDLDAMTSGFPSRAVLEAFYWNKGIAELLCGSDKCLTSLRQALQMRPEWPAGSDILTRALQTMLDEEKGVETIKERVALARHILKQTIADAEERKSSNRYGLSFQQTGLVRNAMGRALIRLGEFEEAVKIFRLAVNSDRSSVIFNSNTAVALERLAESQSVEQKKFEALLEAARFYSEAAAKLKDQNGDKAEIYKLKMNSAWCYFEGRNYSLALGELKESVELGVDPAETYRCMGIIFMLQKRRQEAKEWFEKAIKAGHPEAPDLEIRVQTLGN